MSSNSDPVKFQFTVKNTINPYPNPPTYPVETESDKSLVDALTDFGHSSTTFSFVTEVCHTCPYLVEVTANGKSAANGHNTFWEALRFDGKRIRPLCLHCYKVGNDDQIFLRFGRF